MLSRGWSTPCWTAVALLGGFAIGWFAHRATAPVVRGLDPVAMRQPGDREHAHGEADETGAELAAPLVAAAATRDDIEVSRTSATESAAPESTDSSEHCARIAELEAENALLRAQLRTTDERHRPVFEQLAAQHYRYESLYRELLPFFLDPELVYDHPVTVLPTFLRALDETGIGAMRPERDSEESCDRSMLLEALDDGPKLEVHTEKEHWESNDRVMSDGKTLLINVEVPPIPGSDGRSLRDFCGGHATLTIMCLTDSYYAFSLELDCDPSEPPRFFGSAFQLKWDPDNRFTGSEITRIGSPDPAPPTLAEATPLLRAIDRFFTAFERRIH